MRLIPPKKPGVAVAKKFLAKVLPVHLDLYEPAAEDIALKNPQPRRRRLQIINKLITTCVGMRPTLLKRINTNQARMQRFALDANNGRATIKNANQLNALLTVLGRGELGRQDKAQTKE